MNNTHAVGTAYAKPLNLECVFAVVLKCLKKMVNGIITHKRTILLIKDNHNIHQLKKSKTMKTITVKSGTAEDGIKCFSTTGEPVEEYQGEAELVWQFKGHTLWHTCDRVTPELAKENGWDTRQVWIVPSPPAPLLNQSASKEPLEVGQEILPDFIVDDTCFSYCNDGLHIYINGELEGVLDPVNINGLRHFLNQLPL